MTQLKGKTDPKKIGPEKTDPEKTVPEQGQNQSADSAQATPDSAPASRRKLPRWLLYGLIGSGVLALLAIAFRPAPLAVDIGEVVEAPLQVTIEAEGKTQVTERYVVAAPVAGRLQRIQLDAGDSVSAGNVVAQLDPLPLSSQVRTAQARLQQLQAELAGVDTQRPKPQALAQAAAQLRAAEAEEAAARAAVAEAQADLAQASRDRQRAEALESAGAIPRQERESAQLTETRRQQALETAQKQLDGAIAKVAAAQEAIPLLRAQQQDPDYLLNSYQAQIAGIEAELENLTDRAQRTTIAAPVSGTVLRVPEASARFVQAGEPLLEIGDAAKLELVIDVLSADAVKIEPGDPILVEQWGGDGTLVGKVSYVEPAAFTEVSALGVEEQRVNIVGTLAEQKNSDVAVTALGDGYRIEARIVIWEDRDVLQVPVSALYRCGQAWCVFKVDNNRAYLQTVAIGQRNALAASVIAGLESGEQVILHPNEQVEPRRKVRAR